MIHTAVKTFKKLTEEEERSKAETYGDIKLIFGKYKGMTLNQVTLEEKGSDYLQWLLEAMTKDTTKKKTPTQLAIMKFIKLCV